MHLDHSCVASYLTINIVDRLNAYKLEKIIEKKEVI